MATIPAQAFTASDAKKNLDIAAKFYVAGASASPAIVAKPTNTPPIPASAAVAGVAAALIPHFSYESELAVNGTDWHSKFSLLLDRNEKLETMLGDTLASIIPITGVGNVPNLITTGQNLTVAGVSTLEQLIYNLAEASEDVALSKVQIGTANYIKIVADYTFTPGGGGGMQ